MSEHDKKHTITTGPFYVGQILFGTPSPPAVLMAIIKNPTNKTLSASIDIERCSIAADPNPTTSITFPFVNFTPETPEGSGIPLTPIPPHTCLTFEIDISALVGTTTLRVSSTGDYVVGEDRPKCGKLEIEVVGGIGRATNGQPPVLLPGLVVNSSLLFRYGDFVVCETEKK